MEGSVCSKLLELKKNWGWVMVRVRVKKNFLHSLSAPLIGERERERGGGGYNF